MYKGVYIFICLLAKGLGVARGKKIPPQKSGVGYFNYVRFKFYYFYLHFAFFLGFQVPNYISVSNANNLKNVFTPTQKM